MTKLINEIVINASTEKVWGILTNLEALEKYDPTVKKSTLITSEKSGIGAKRKVDMLDYFAGTLKINPTPKTFSILKFGSSFKYLRIFVINTSRLLPKK